MTSDAKIGLLLGLVFIFIIAFIINGLPTLRSDENNNELTTTMVSSQNETLGIGTREREVINRTKQVGKQRPDEVQTPSAGKQDIRFKTAVLKRPSAATETGKTIEIERKAKPAPPSPTTAKKSEVKKPRRVKPTLPRVYVVAEGDNLTVVAKKFYGAEEGNKIVNITRIFQANRKVLASPDEIYEGQKIVIPSLPASHQNRDKTGDIFTSTMFERVKSIGKRHFSDDGSKAKQGGQYVVRKDDSLWRIAAEQLGDGSRYSEIAKLNAGILDDEDSLPVGMRLKMPVR